MKLPELSAMWSGKSQSSPSQGTRKGKGRKSMEAIIDSVSKTSILVLISSKPKDLIAIFFAIRGLLCISLHCLELVSLLFSFNLSGTEGR